MDSQDIYRRRINTAIDYIETNLHHKLDVASISREACFSPFHFQRIFSAHMGESLYAFVTRLRVEKAATMLHTRQISITETAHAVGFEDSATFARAFKKRFGESASDWLVSHRSNRRNSRIHQAGFSETGYTKISMNHQSQAVQTDTEHICCAFSDRKCSEGYRMKKDWLTKQFDTGYRFYRLNERAKVFIEHAPTPTD